MATTYQKCDPSVRVMALEIIAQFPSHEPLTAAKVNIDFVFGYAETDEHTGMPKGVALKHHGNRALGICRKISLKDRALGRGDAEITLDGDWWRDAKEEEQRALLDHELHHLCPAMDKRGFISDDLGRPIIKMRRHTVEIGWFAEIAARHGFHSMEQIQARRIMEEFQTCFWPDAVTDSMVFKQLQAAKS